MNKQLKIAINAQLMADSGSGRVEDLPPNITAIGVPTKVN
jgi:hypothetical protein